MPVSQQSENHYLNAHHDHENLPRLAIHTYLHQQKQTYTALKDFQSLPLPPTNSQLHHSFQELTQSSAVHHRDIGVQRIWRRYNS